MGRKSRRTLSRREILDKTDLCLTEEYVEEWGGVIYLRVLTGKDRYELESVYANLDESELSGEQSNWDIIVDMVIRSVCDENGHPLFTKADKETLLEKNSSVLFRLCKRAYAINKMGTEEFEDLKKSSGLEAGTTSSSPSL